MIITIQIIKVYHVDTGEGDTTDPESVKRQLRASNAEVVGPSDVN